MKPTSKDLLQLQATGWFDADWYADTYRDVAALGMDPALHYLVYGSRLKRDPGPAFPSSFFKDVFKISDKYEPATRLTEIIKRSGAPAPAGERVLKAANDVGLRGRYNLAEQLAETFLPEELRYSVNIIRANAAARDGNRYQWLEHVNAYLSHSGVAPLALKEGWSLFERLSARTSRRVHDGPLVSVLMPAFNAEKTVEMAVHSLLTQTWANLELLIVDDCSQDGTWSILQKLAAEDSRIRIFRNDMNVGPYVSKNIALSQAQGTWVTGHDADDWAHPERLERQVLFTEKLGVPASMAGMLRMAYDGSFVRLNRIGGFVHDGACRSALISLMIRTQYLRDVLGSWDVVRVGGDSELLRRIERLEGKPVRQLPEVTMLCYDNPEGLTNHALLGYSETGGVSPHRVEYKNNFTAAHAGLDKKTSRLLFPSNERTFEAPQEMLNEADAVNKLVEAYKSNGISFKKQIKSNVVIVTNLVFPGGNASSTLDEIKFFVDQGIDVSLVHCPVDTDLGKKISNRFDPWKHLIINWTELDKVEANVVICRHPRVVTSHAFSVLSSKIECGHFFVVKNNSCMRPDGRLVYDMTKAVEAAQQINAKVVSFCAVSNAMRDELLHYRSQTGSTFSISETIWTPTFDLTLYKKEANEKFSAPFIIGRHGRDGAEKWHEDREQLLQAYPDSPDFEILILGGAANAKSVLGEMPENWTVYEFGAIEPGAYLSKLDAFVYFPHSRLEEAFGRTIVEAMLAAVPVILPTRFEQTFGNLAIYCGPSDVQDVVRKLSTSDPSDRIRYLSEVQEIAAGNFSSAAIANRMEGTGVHLNRGHAAGRTQLSDRAAQFQLSLLPVAEQRR